MSGSCVRSRDPSDRQKSDVGTPTVLIRLFFEAEDRNCPTAGGVLRVVAIHPAKPSGRRRGDRTIMNHSLTAYRAIILRRISPLLQSLSPSLSPPPPLEARHSSCKWAKKAARGYLLPHRDFERASEREGGTDPKAGGRTYGHGTTGSCKRNVPLFEFVALDPA